MKIIQIDEKNIDNEHICCAIGNDKENKARAETKKKWMKSRFKDGLIFKRLDDRGKIFIEYIPIENVWKPIIGKKYMVINCLWVSGKFKGKGISNLLLDECIHDAKKMEMDGVAAVTSTKVKPFLTDKKFYENKGFVSIDTALPYFELMALTFNKNAKTPVFSKNAQQGICQYKKGLTFIYSNQCPFMEEYVALLASISKKRGIPYEIVQLRSCDEAQKIGSPFGTLGIYYQGEFKTHELMPEAKFERFLEGII